MIQKPIARSTTLCGERIVPSTHTCMHAIGIGDSTRSYCNLLGLFKPGETPGLKCTK